MRDYIFVFILGLTIIFCSLSVSGCGKAIAVEEKVADDITAVDDKTYGIFRLVSTTGEIIHYVSELHRAGVDTEVIDTIQDAVDKAHAIAEKEHLKLQIKEPAK